MNTFSPGTNAILLVLSLVNYHFGGNKFRQFTANALEQPVHPYTQSLLRDPSVGPNSFDGRRAILVRYGVYSSEKIMLILIIMQT